MFHKCFSISMMQYSEIVPVLYGTAQLAIPEDTIKVVPPFVFFP